jgi:CubicO group peptidase (beta-lactamase class C family)
MDSYLECSVINQQYQYFRIRNATGNPDDTRAEAGISDTSIHALLQLPIVPPATYKRPFLGNNGTCLSVESRRRVFVDMTRNKTDGHRRWWRPIGSIVVLCLFLWGMFRANAGAKAQGDGVALNDADVNKAGGSDATFSETDLNAVDEYINAQMRSARIPGLSLAIVKGDQVVYLKGFGRAGPSGREVTPQTSFMIGSITKPFTALAVMQLVEAGKIDLDTPVQRYIPWFRVADPQASAQITVRQLLNMTSGLPQIAETQFWTEQDAAAIERSVRFLKTVELGRPVGTFGYSNANYDTLGMIVQAVSGQPYEEYIKEHIFGPLEMQNSFASLEEAMQHDMASGHRRWFGVPIPFTVAHNRSELPAGFLISSAEDMAHFLVAQMNGGRYEDKTVLSPDGIALMHTDPTPNTYGLGWEFVREDGRTLINHDGGTFNFQASLFINPEARVGVFVAANVMSALDAFASPSGSTPVNGITTRGIAQHVLSLATNQPLPAQGLRNGWLIPLFNLVLLVLTVALAIALVRVPGRYQRLAERGIARPAEFLWRGGLVALLHLSWPLLLLYLTLRVPFWKVISTFQPDLVYWLHTVATIVVVKGIVEEALLWRIFGKRRSHQLLQPV